MMSISTVKFPPMVAWAFVPRRRWTKTREASPNQGFGPCGPRAFPGSGSSGPLKSDQAERERDDEHDQEHERVRAAPRARPARREDRVCGLAARDPHERIIGRC